MDVNYLLSLSLMLDQGRMIAGYPVMGYISNKCHKCSLLLTTTTFTTQPGGKEIKAKGHLQKRKFLSY